MWACIIPLELTGSVSEKVALHQQVDQPTHRLQHQMLGCQVTQTRLSLTAHTWPYLIHQGAVLLVSILHSHQVDWFRHDGLSNFNVISNVKDVKDAKTHLYSMKFKSQLRK